MAMNTGAEAFVFASEREIPLSAHNVWQRKMQPKREARVWDGEHFRSCGARFVSLCKAGGGDPNAIADQCGHDIGVSVNVYTQSTLDSKLELVNRLERSLKAPVVN